MRIGGSWRFAPAWLVALVVTGAGCPSTSVYRTADPVPVGHWHVSVAADVGGIADQAQESRAPTASLELAARRGVAENLDIGAKLYTFGLELSATWRVVRGTWSLALAPSIAALRSNESGVSPRALYLFAGSAFIASRPLSKRWHIGTGPIAGYGMYRPETGGTAHGAWIGGFLLLDRAIGKRSHLVPEIGVYRVVAGDVPVRGGAFRAGLAWRWEL